MKQLNIGKMALDLVLASVGSAADGFRIAPDIGVKHFTEALLRDKLDSTRRKNTDYQAKAQAFRVAQKALNQALNKAIPFVQVTRDNLKPKLGTQYSVAWNRVGFVNNTLRMPRTVTQAMALLGSMELFLRANPEMVVPETVTPELAAEACNNLRVAVSDLAHAKVAMRQQKTVRDAAIADLRKTLMLLRRELSLLLADNDPRWAWFGFKVPSDVSVPEAPAGLKVVPGSNGIATLSWGKPVNTDRFHVFQETVGVDTAPERIATTTSTSKVVTQLTPGTQVRFCITAVNAAGESLPSEIVEIVVPGSAEVVTHAKNVKGAEG